MGALIRVLLLLVGSDISGVAWAACLNQCVEVKGVSSFAHADVAWARQMAIRDALQSAVMQCQATVSTQQQVENYQLTHSHLTVRSRAVVKNFSILKETQDPDEKLVTVRLKVCLQPARSDCAQPLGAGFHPRLAIATVLVANPYEARDIRDLPQGWRRMLVQQLRQMGYRNLQPVYLDPAILSVEQVQPALDPERLQAIREETGAQFLLLSVVRALAPRHRTDTLLPDTMDWMLEGVQRAYNYELDPNQRDITVDWYLVDLNHQKIVRQGQLSRHVVGEVRVGRDKPFGSLAFARTVTGRAMLAQVDDQARQLMKVLRCMPFEAEVLEVRNEPGGEHQQVIFFATPESGLREGDQLTIYHREGDPVRMGQRALGMLQRPVGFVRVKQIMDRFAVGEVVAKKGNVAVGDLIRSW